MTWSQINSLRGQVWMKPVWLEQNTSWQVIALHLDPRPMIPRNQGEHLWAHSVLFQLRYQGPEEFILWMYINLSDLKVNSGGHCSLLINKSSNIFQLINEKKNTRDHNWIDTQGILLVQVNVFVSCLAKNAAEVGVFLQQSQHEALFMVVLKRESKICFSWAPCFKSSLTKDLGASRVWCFHKIFLWIFQLERDVKQLQRFWFTVKLWNAVLWFKKRSEPGQKIFFSVLHFLITSKKVNQNQICLEKNLQCYFHEETKSCRRHGQRSHGNMKHTDTREERHQSQATVRSGNQIWMCYLLRLTISCSVSTT